MGGSARQKESSVCLCVKRCTKVYQTAKGVCLSLEMRGVGPFYSPRGRFIKRVQRQRAERLRVALAGGRARGGEQIQATAPD